MQDALREAEQCAAGLERLKRGQQLLLLDKGSCSLSVQAEGAGASTANLDLTALATLQPDVLAVAQYLFFLLAREGQLGPKIHQQVGLRPTLTESWRLSETDASVCFPHRGPAGPAVRASSVALVAPRLRPTGRTAAISTEATALIKGKLGRGGAVPASAYCPTWCGVRRCRLSLDFKILLLHTTSL